MAFYIKPPEGAVSLASLEKFGRKRLIFLKEVLKCDGSEGFRRLVSETDTAIYSECLIEGSKRDRMSHFLLRLVCCEDHEMLNFLLQAETELFGYRFSSMNTQELCHFLKSTHRFVTKCLNFKTCANDDDICNLHMALDMIYSATSSWQVIVEKYMNDCNTETFQIPFQLALSLIAGRQVELMNGLASVPFSKLHVVLSSLFHTMLKGGLRKAAMVCNNFTGEREMKLVQDLELFCQNLLGSSHSRRSVPGHCLSYNQIDEAVAFFPPCMKHLHGVLRRRHRLRHHSRVQYTLYLKEVGLPLDEALDFWKREYSQPQVDRSGSKVKCCHTWQKDHKRYIYNIRHMYGLEGSRTNYSAHSCKFLQMYTPGPGEEGGCPFSQSDDTHLQTFMDIEEVDQLFQEEILSLSKSRQYSEACRKFFMSKLNHKVRKVLSNWGSREQGEWYSDDVVTKEGRYIGDGSDIVAPQRDKTSIKGASAIMKEHSELCRQFEATGRLLEPDIILGGTCCKCTEEIVSRTIEYKSGDFGKPRLECSYDNAKVNMSLSSLSSRSERTQCKGKCAMSKRSPDVCKRKIVSHNSNDEGSQNLDPKDSGYESVQDSMVSFPKAVSFSALQSCTNADKEFGKGKRPFPTERMEWAGKSRFVESVTRQNDAYVNMKESSDHACETKCHKFTHDARTEVDGQINEMASDGNRNLQVDGVILQQDISLEGRDADQLTSNKRLDIGNFNTRQGFREVSESNARGNVEKKININGKNDCRKGKSVLSKEGACQQLYQNVRNQDVRKPSDFYTSFRRLISELKSLEGTVESTTYNCPKKANSYGQNSLS